MRAIFNELTSDGFLGKRLPYFRGYLKNVFWPNLGVGRSVPILEILEYSFGWNLAAALTLNQNPIFEIASSKAVQPQIISQTKRSIQW